MEPLIVINPDFLLHKPKLIRSTNENVGIPNWYPKSPPISPSAIDDYNKIHNKINNSISSFDLDEIDSTVQTNNNKRSLNNIDIDISPLDM